MFSVLKVPCLPVLENEVVGLVSIAVVNSHASSLLYIFFLFIGSTAEWGGGTQRSIYSYQPKPRRSSRESFWNHLFKESTDSVGFLFENKLYLYVRMIRHDHTLNYLGT